MGIDDIVKEILDNFFNEHLFDILSEMKRLALEGGLPFEIETTGSVTYHFNDSTRVLTLFPKASLSARESVERGASS